MPVVLCFGNPDIPEDAVAVELGRSLDVPGFTFVHLSSPEEIVDYIEEDVYVMDVAQGIDEVTLITDPSRVVPPPRITAHDIDPALFLRLVEQLYGVAITDHRPADGQGDDGGKRPGSEAYCHSTFRKWAEQEIQGSYDRMSFSIASTISSCGRLTTAGR